MLLCLFFPSYPTVILLEDKENFRTIVVKGLIDNHALKYRGCIKVKDTYRN